MSTDAPSIPDVVLERARAMVAAPGCTCPDLQELQVTLAQLSALVERYQDAVKVVEEASDVDLAKRVARGQRKLDYGR